MRAHGKVDALQSEVVTALRNAGCRVQSLATIGKGCPDLLVLDRYGELRLLEVKAPRQDLTEWQERWHRHWAGAQLHIVYSVEEALRVCGYELL